MRLFSFLLLAACTATPSNDIALAELDTVPQLGRARRIYATTNCTSKRGYLPYIYYSDPWPRVNTWILLTASKASIESDMDTSILGGWVVSHFLNEQPFTLPTVPGCQLLVRPDSILLALPRQPGNAKEGERIGAWSEKATAFLIINPLPATLGYSFYIQFIEWAPGENFAGLLISHTVQLEIGNTTWADRDG